MANLMEAARIGDDEAVQIDFTRHVISDQHNQYQLRVFDFPGKVNIQLGIKVLVKQPKFVDVVNFRSTKASEDISACLFFPLTQYFRGY